MQASHTRVARARNKQDDAVMLPVDSAFSPTSVREPSRLVDGRRGDVDQVRTPSAVAGSADPSRRALRNRVTPEGEIVATAYAGLLMGNPGAAQVMQPSRYTELSFLDEATALAAGHRPRFECRRADAERLPSCGPSRKGIRKGTRGDVRGASARPTMDEALHAERLGRRSGKRTYRACHADLPSGAFVRYGLAGEGARPCLIIGNHLRLGIRPGTPRSSGRPPWVRSFC
jgi:hypothetical protein